MDDLILLTSAVFEQMTNVFTLYTTTWVFGGVLSLWILRKVVRIFRHLH